MSILDLKKRPAEGNLITSTESIVLRTITATLIIKTNCNTFLLQCTRGISSTIEDIWSAPAHAPVGSSVSKHTSAVMNS